MTLEEHVALLEGLLGEGNFPQAANAVIELSKALREGDAVFNDAGVRQRCLRCLDRLLQDAPADLLPALPVDTVAIICVRAMLPNPFAALLPGDRGLAFGILERLILVNGDKREAWLRGEAIKWVAGAVANGLRSDHETPLGEEDRGRGFGILEQLIAVNGDNKEAWLRGEAITSVAGAVANGLCSDQKTPLGEGDRGRGFGILERLIAVNRDNREAWLGGMAIGSVASAVSNGLNSVHKTPLGEEDRSRGFDILGQLIEVTKGNGEAWSRGLGIELIATAVASAFRGHAMSGKTPPSSSDLQRGCEVLWDLLDATIDHPAAWSGLALKRTAEALADLKQWNSSPGLATRDGLGRASSTDDFVEAYGMFAAIASGHPDAKPEQQEVWESLNRLVHAEDPIQLACSLSRELVRLIQGLPSDQWARSSEVIRNGVRRWITARPTRAVWCLPVLAATSTYASTAPSAQTTSLAAPGRPSR